MNGKNVYSPYGEKDFALEEYKALRNEILESQKQRVSLFASFIGGIGVLFSYLIKDGSFSMQEAVILAVLTLPPSFFTYSTRIRERRIASFLSGFLPLISPWSRISSYSSKVKFNPFQKSSSTMIFTMILIDIILIYVSIKYSASEVDILLLLIMIFVLITNILLFIYVNKLKEYKKIFEEIRKKMTNDDILKNN